MATITRLEISTDSASGIEDRCRVYRREFGFDDAHIHPDTGIIHLPTTSAAGAMTSPALGRAVRQLLGAVPVFSVDHRGRHSWVLLAAAPATIRDAEHMTLRLFTCGVKPLFRGATIPLPTPGTPRRVWLYPPHSRTLPPLTALGDAITEATRLGATTRP